MSSKGLGRGLDALLRRTDMGAARQEKNDTPEKEFKYAYDIVCCLESGILVLAMNRYLDRI